mmetsp:Transcript_120891/g.349285  ORF Transcript_120891/g.349285 Transcript_120891/m.349285 type:complete len:97 (+) Transcript_120891:76-366(+)
MVLSSYTVFNFASVTLTSNDETQQKEKPDPNQGDSFHHRHSTYGFCFENELFHISISWQHWPLGFSGTVSMMHFSVEIFIARQKFDIFRDMLYWSI